MTTIVPPPPLSSGGRTAIRVLLVVAAAVVAVTALVTLSAVAFGLSTFRAITDSKPLPRTVRSLTIDTAEAAMAVRIVSDDAATEPRADLRMVTQSDRQGLLLANEPSGTRITLDGEPPRVPWGRAGEITVVLPPNVARTLSVTVQQQTGMLSTDVDLDALTAKLTQGDVALGGSARKIDVQLRNGDIRTRSPIAVAESVTADIKHGDISLAFRIPPRTVDAVSDLGDVWVGLPGPGPYRVRAESGGQNGDTTVRVPQTTDPHAPEVAARSMNGDVKVTLLR